MNALNALAFQRIHTATAANANGAARSCLVEIVAPAQAKIYRNQDFSSELEMKPDSFAKAGARARIARLSQPDRGSRRGTLSARSR
jgi:hypothetical protein